MRTRTREVRGAIDSRSASFMSLGINNKNSFLTALTNELGTRTALAVGGVGTFIVRATERDSSIHDFITDTMIGDFTLQLPVDECYMVSFIAHSGDGMMDEFWDNMVFGCGPDQLHRMERLGWLKSKTDPNGGKRARKDYRLTPAGRKVLDEVRKQVEELYRDIVIKPRHHKK